jgi:hypothetical protein
MLEVEMVVLLGICLSSQERADWNSVRKLRGIEKTGGEQRKFAL